ncbi:MAG TPA: ABC transporter ATP-binding protein [Verrucomicrobiales bacterium]|nr:ABC transporter ATP-binding protein [Verrucomicrobiales bacterium]
MISIRTESVSKSFGSTRALDGVTLEIEPGELFFLLGPSGCGKTTLLRVLAGFATPDAGSVFLDGVDVTGVPPHRRRTALMFQNYALWPHLNVFRNVAFGLEQQKLPKTQIAAQVRHALAAVRLEDCAQRSVDALSGGQQQRVALARALVVRPQCLLLDEPLSNLDAQLRLEMRHEIRRVSKESGLTTVYVTHDQKEALATADRIAILHEGRVVQSGSPVSVYRLPHNAFVASFMGETNFVPGALRQIAAGVAIVETSLGAFRGRLGNPHWNPAPGEKALLSIRPEAIEFASPSETPINGIRGRVAGSLYFGEIARHVIDAGDGLRLNVAELNPSDAQGAGRKSVTAVVRAEDVIVLEPGSSCSAL